MVCTRTIVLAVLLLPACFPGFNDRGKDRCLSDADCLDGRFCVVSEAEPLGTCSDNDPNAPPTPEECAPFDRDSDGAFTIDGCGSALDCDDGDDKRSPLLPEFCDGVDNDCDAEVDEGLRNACGGCEPLPTETCDGRDEDCDGLIDDGTTNACGQCGPALPDWCDGLDNDCDGEIDEDLDCSCEDGEERPCPAPEEAALSLCSPGQQTCLEGRWGPCEDVAITTEVEVCDDMDNDCDGEIDEGYDLSSDRSNCGACGAICSTLHADAAPCVNGRCDLQCRPGFLDLDGLAGTGCEYACAASGAEVCGNGLDDDCDGQTDPNCDTSVLSGTYTWFNLFGRAATRQPPGLVTGVLTTDPGDPDRAQVTNLVRYTSGDDGGSLVLNRDSTREVTLSTQGELTLAPEGETDPIGGLYRGVITPDPRRSMAVLMEYDGDRQIASMAVLIRSDLPDGADLDHTHIRGQYQALHFLPDRLLSGALEPGPVRITGWSLDADSPQGVARETFTLDGSGLQTSARTGGAYGGEAGAIAMSLPSDDGTHEYQGAFDATGDPGCMVFTLTSDTEAPAAEPGLVLASRRQTSPALDQLPGVWTLAGLQSAYDAENDEIRYNAVQQKMRLAAPTTGDYLQLLINAEGEEVDVGTVTIGSSSAGERAGELRVTLMIPDNLQGPRIELRGILNTRGDTAIFWEIDDLGDGLPVTSVFVALRHGE